MSIYPGSYTFVHIPMCIYLCPYTYVHIPMCIYLCTYIMCIYLCPYTFIHVLLTMYSCPYTYVVLIGHRPFPYTYGFMNIYITILLYIYGLAHVHIPLWPIGTPIAVIYLGVKSALLNLYRIWLQKRLFYVIYSNSLRSGYRT